MPTVTEATHTHVYSSYLMTLTRHWAYARTNRVPGRNAYDRSLVTQEATGSR